MNGPKLKQCKAEGCEEEFYQYNSLQRHCSGSCKASDSENKKRTSGIKIKPVSDKRAEELAIYRPIRDAYLKEFTTCEVKECTNPSTHIHHKGGRLGKTVYDSNLFMAVCNGCHPSKIHLNPEWSRAMGYLI